MAVAENLEIQRSLALDCGGLLFTPLEQEGTFIITKKTERFFAKNLPVNLAVVEYQTLQQIGEHPNIERLQGLVNTGHGHFAILKEYLPGGSLKDNSQSLTLDENLAVICNIAGALDFVHSRGYVHRDVKPGNIMFDADGNPKLVDFGIARKQGCVDFDETYRWGTTPFAAPEQHLGEFSPKSDVHALNAILLNCFLNLPLKKLGEVLSNTFWNDETVGDLPEQIKRMLTKNLSRQTEKRQSAGEFLQELESFRAT